MLPFRTPVWLRLSSGVEITSWPLLDPGGVFLCGSARTARAYAEALGGRLPLAAELEEHFRLALALGKVIEPPIAKCGTSTAEQSPRVLAALAALDVQWHEPAANTGKPWLGDPAPPGKAYIYGWWVRAPSGLWRGIATYPSATPGWRVIQPRSTFHRDDDTACGYETHIMVVR